MLRTIARYTSPEWTVPSRDDDELDHHARACPAPSSSDVAPVESASGSIGNIRTPVYTVVVCDGRVLVDGRVRRNERVDVGDRHQHLDVAVRQPLGHLDLIEVARRVVVDRRPEQAAQIANVGARLEMRRMRRQRRQLLLHLAERIQARSHALAWPAPRPREDRWCPTSDRGDAG